MTSQVTHINTFAVRSTGVIILHLDYVYNNNNNAIPQVKFGEYSVYADLTTTLIR